MLPFKSPELVISSGNPIENQNSKGGALNRQIKCFRRAVKARVVGLGAEWGGGDVLAK